MSEININYRGSTIASMDSSGTKTLLTSGKYCEDNIAVVYTRPSAPVPALQTKSVAFTPAETIQTSSVTADAGYDGLSAVNVSVAAIPSAYIIPANTSSITSNGIYDITSFASVDVNVSGGGGGDHSAEDAIIDRTISGFYENSRVSSIWNYKFLTCSALEGASFQNVLTIGRDAFNGCSSLTTISFPNATTLGSNAFSGCLLLTSANFPNVTNVGSNAFQNCNMLEMASFPKGKTINSSAFYKCWHLLSLYLLGSSVMALSNSNAFTQTPISTYTTSTGGVNGSIYVPASLYSKYIASTNWSKFSSRFVSV